MYQTTIASSPPAQEGAIYVPAGLMVMGATILSVVATTVTVSFFLSGLKAKIQEVNSRINEIGLENKSSNEKLLLRLEYKDGEVKELVKKYERLQEEMSSLIHYVNKELRCMNYKSNNQGNTTGPNFFQEE